jgi:hypothetical protein
MLYAVLSSGAVNSVIRITGIGDRDRPEWLIRIIGMLEGSTRSRDTCGDWRLDAGRR